MDSMFQSSSVTPGVTLRDHMLKTFTWMFLGVAVSFVTAMALNIDPSFIQGVFAKAPYIYIIMIFAQLGLVVSLISRLGKMSTTTAKVLFLVYALITGVTFSFIGMHFTRESIALAFGMTCVFFGSLVAIGYTTKVDLSKVGAIAIAGLMALIIYGFMAMIFNWETNIFIYSMIGLVIFMALTAWDVQKMKRLYEANKHDEKMLANLSIYSALQLYLDFVNIFIYILNIVGKRR